MKTICLQCQFSPCICWYIESLAADESRAVLALNQLKAPMPHRPGCPCLTCIARVWSEWEEFVESEAKELQR